MASLYPWEVEEDQALDDVVNGPRLLTPWQIMLLKIEG